MISYMIRDITDTSYISNAFLLERLHSRFFLKGVVTDTQDGQHILDVKKAVKVNI